MAPVVFFAFLAAGTWAGGETLPPRTGLFSFFLSVFLSFVTAAGVLLGCDQSTVEGGEGRGVNERSNKLSAVSFELKLRTAVALQRVAFTFDT